MTAARLILAFVLVCGLSPRAAVAQPVQGARVAVVDFYAPSPLAPVSGIIPEERAADDLTSLLAASPGQQVVVLSRMAVREAESAIAWRASDMLRFARLQQLARALNAVRLMVGWIQRFDLDRSGPGGQGGGGGRFFSGFATVTVQVFDAKEVRVVSQVQQSAYERGTATRSVMAERLLRTVLEHALLSVISAGVSGSR